MGKRDKKPATVPDDRYRRLRSDDVSMDRNQEFPRQGRNFRYGSGNKRMGMDFGDVWLCSHLPQQTKPDIILRQRGSLSVLHIAPNRDHRFGILSQKCGYVPVCQILDHGDRNIRHIVADL